MEKEFDVNNLLLTGFHFPHHSENSGYEQIRHFIPADYVDAANFPFFDAPFGTNPKRMNMLLFDLFLKYKIKKFDVVHHLYPENHLIYSITKKTKAKIIGTIHLPVADFLDKPSETPKDVFLKKRRRKLFNLLDGIIVLSSEEVAPTKTMFPNAEVVFIPHGVADFKAYFREIKLVSKQNDMQDNMKDHTQNKIEICTIGTNYRDIALYENIVNQARETHSNWHFHLIGVHKEWKDKFKNYPNITIHPYLSEKQYLQVLAKCHINFLPLLKATANNVLLEAHSVGTISVASNLPSVQDYSLLTTLLYDNANQAFTLLEDIANWDIKKLNLLKKQTLEQAIKFHWAKISKEFLDLYMKISKK